ncbi:glycoside hydrolase family 27 protein [Granulicella sp. 5B5]|nr:glycoside hydrolase family 27 protein [Granulicella sp. 5B5]
MGWNSWDAYGLTITEPQFRANVSVLKAKLAPFGYNYAVIDEGWYFENPQDRDHPGTLHYAIDPTGRYVPVPARFPSAAENAQSFITLNGSAKPKLAATIEGTSFKALADWVHSQGLKFGIHIIRGIPRVSVERNLPIEGSAFHAMDAADTTDACPWDPTSWGVKDTPAGQAWYDSLMKQYADWGVDLIKVDCIGDHPYKLTEIKQIRRAIDKTGRPIVLSLSPGPMNLIYASEVGDFANMWRISDDEWDVWASTKKGPQGISSFPQGVKDQFPRLASWAQYAKPGTWPDADMLAVGVLGPHPGWGDPRNSRFTPDEQRTLLTLWSIARSPLIVGANLTQLDPATLKLLTNKEVLALDQQGTNQHQALQEGDLIAWRSTLPNGHEALALFNLGDKPLTVQRTLASIDPALGGQQWKARDVWAGQYLPGILTSLNTKLPRHGCQLLLLH